MELPTMVLILPEPIQKSLTQYTEPLPRVYGIVKNINQN